MVDARDEVETLKDSASAVLTVNGAVREIDVGADTSLLSYLRDRLDLTGTRYGCGEEQCGACMVLVDGEALPSCARPAVLFAERTITTIEGLGTPEHPHPLQTAFLAEQAGQCGYCLSGILISAAALLLRNPDPERAAVASALDPNLCRCGAHSRIINAVLRAASAMRGGV